MIADRGGDRDAAGLGDGLEPRRDVDAVTEDVVALDDDVAEIDADAELDASVLRHVLIALDHRPLDLGGTGDRVHDARKLDQHAVAGDLDDAALVLGDLADRPARRRMRLQRSERAGLVQPHEPAVADDVGGQDRGKTALLHEMRPRGLRAQP